MKPPLCLAVAATAAGLCACSVGAPAPQLKAPGGDPARGAQVVAHAGCAACHVIPGIRGARGLVGPPLTGVGSRTTIAGVLPNTPEALVRWVASPQSVIPGNAMPDMGLSEQQARDVAAYLETLS